MDKEEIPRGLQIAALVAAVLLTAILVSHGGDIDGAAWLFLSTLPACVLGLVIYKLIVREKFRRPKSWPEWIFLYIIGLMIGGPLFALAKFLFGEGF